MDYQNIIITICTAIGTVITIVKILGNKFDKIDAKFDKVDGKFCTIQDHLNEIKNDIRRLDGRVSHIEGYLIGRDQGPRRTGTEK